MNIKLFVFVPKAISRLCKLASLCIEQSKYICKPMILIYGKVHLITLILNCTTDSIYLGHGKEEQFYHSLIIYMIEMCISTIHFETLKFVRGYGH